MKMRLALFLAASWITPVFAGPKFQIEQVNPRFPAQEMAAPDVTVHLVPSELPPVEKRDRLILKAGLANDVMNWDQLDRDLFYLSAKRAGSPSKLSEKYKSLSPKKLEKFWALVRSDS